MIPIPSLESVSSEYARLTKLHAELMERAAKNEAASAELHAKMGHENAQSQHAGRVTSLLSGVDFVIPAPMRDQLAALSAERTAIADAIKELAGQIGLERERASRVVVEQFKAEHAGLARRFFKAIADAARVHAEFEDMRIAFQRAGVHSTSFIDFGADLFDRAGYRNNDVAIAMRAAVRRGYLDNKDLPDFAQ